MCDRYYSGLALHDIVAMYRLTDKRIELFSRLKIELVQSGRRLECYWNNHLVPICSSDDPWALNEIISEGVPKEVILTVSQFYNEAEEEFFSCDD